MGAKNKRAGDYSILERTKQIFEGASMVANHQRLAVSPREHLAWVRALRDPPVGRDHPAYQPCMNFLTYFEDTWLKGPFSTMWCKHMVRVQRTTNLAENYHGRLRRLCGGRKYPRYAELVRVFQAFTMIALVGLRTLDVTAEG
ncbi:unnamed protein product [Cylicocyclus nassatus]|uniref:Uncharacterized protein n=1 Tax=Cylicocyclus nassatus TaxID=53992 RepID=A0AA36GQL6_CYLNA|nr:unnamed protein product [Cylicocyclus nassatus]